MNDKSFLVSLSSVAKFATLLRNSILFGALSELISGSKGSDFGPSIFLGLNELISGCPTAEVSGLIEVSTNDET
ncbi:hypothetical protein CYMTET_34282 [Cymbomonas tetramitiformis]|uniref:Uncharacterized protein n=1 Tax=Cymbomonas tetramitiformis TaxID=36881 RepID=A0AAE0FB77_9CHLO|nr:hypothetical protein CYMTET_34282 [Cymbomonas tetramitiformis]